MKNLTAILCLICIALGASAERVKVRLFAKNSIELINISFDLGTYNLYDGDSLTIATEVGNDKSVELTPNGKQVHVSIDGYDYGNFPSVVFSATDTACILCLNPRNAKQRTDRKSVV